MAHFLWYGCFLKTRILTANLWSSSSYICGPNLWPKNVHQTCAIAGQADQLKTHSHSFGPMLKHRAGQKCDWSGPKLISHPSKKKNVIYEIFMHDPAKTSIRNVIVQKMSINFLAGMLSNAAGRNCDWAICDFSIVIILRE